MTKVIILNESVNNFVDSILNLIYNLQKYSSMFIKLNSEKQSSTLFSDIQLSNFLVCESENMMKNKLLQTSIDICNMMHDKFDNIILNIHNCRDENPNYSCLSQSNINTLLGFCTITCNNFYYRKNEKYDIKKVYDFESTYNHYIKKYSIENPIIDKKSRTEIIRLFIKISDKICEVCDKLKSIMEDSTNLYKSVLIMNDMIRCVAISFICISNLIVTKS